MKKIKDLKDINFEQVDFLQKADNVYRTSDYIVKQKICTTLDEDTLITHLISDDTYYARTQKRDAEYNVIFRERGKEIDGKRIKSSMFTRKYIDQFDNLSFSKVSLQLFKIHLKLFFAAAQFLQNQN